MSKTIKLEDQVYNQLDDLRGKGDTFSDVVQQLLRTREEIFDMIETLERNTDYVGYKQRQLQDLQAAVAGRDRY